MTHASVFSGIGGPEVAATMLGWENLFHCEINPFGRQVLDYWYPNAESYDDITTTDFTEWRGRVDVLTGGFPCQPFSYAGRRRGAEDDRYLWPSMYRAIDEIQPTWVVAENVAGILTMVEQGEVSKVAGTATLFDAFDDLRALKVTDMPSSRCLFRLVPSEPPTDETGCSSSQGVLLQTPTTVQTDEPPEKMRARAEKNGYKNGTKFGSLTNQIKYDQRVRGMLLPTPLVVEREHPERVTALKEAGATRINSRANGEQRPNGLIDFMNFYDLIPETPEQKMMEGQFLLTPSASDGLRGQMTMDSLKRHNKVNAENSNLAEQIAHKVGGGNSRLSPLFTEEMMGFPFSRLSPLFTEEMMGFPLMWTALPFLSESGAPKPSKPTATPSSPK